MNEWRTLTISFKHLTLTIDLFHTWTIAIYCHFSRSQTASRNTASQCHSSVIIFGYCDINCHHYFDIIGITRTRSKHEYKIRPKVARTNYFKYSFFHRYINEWNSLPSEVMSSPSLQSFKVLLVKYLRS